MLCPRLDAPIVLAHGLFGFDRIGLGPVTVANYFRSLPSYLEAAGNRVLVSQVPPIAGIERRSRVLGRRIRAAFGGEPVHLIGHSMGGLDARALLASEGDPGLILSLTTVGTPHLGSALADFAKIGFGRVYQLFSAPAHRSLGFPRHHAPDRAVVPSHASDTGVCPMLQRRGRAGSRGRLPAPPTPARHPG